MIKLSYMEICNSGFMGATKVLWSCDQLNGLVASQVHRICKKTQQVVVESQKAEQEIAKRHACLDNDGNFIRANLTPYSFDNPEKAKAFDEELDTYLNSHFAEIKVDKIDFRQLHHVQGLTPSAICALEPVLTNFPSGD